MGGNTTPSSAVVLVAGHAYRLGHGLTYVVLLGLAYSLATGALAEPPPAA